MRIYLYFIGKPRDVHANALTDEYLKRTGRFATCAMREIHPDRFDPWAKHPTAHKILLDPAGKPWSSQQLADFVGRCEQESRDIVFVIGGHDGLPPAWRPQADVLLSLSAMTFPHELARAMLAEQVYRAFTILRGHPYPR